MNGPPNLRTTPQLVELFRMVEPNDMQRLMQLLDQSPQYTPSMFKQGHKYRPKPKQYTSPYPEMRGRM